MDKRLGVQYYTIRETLKNIEDFEVSCQRIKEMGYEIVQMSGCPLPADEIRDVMDKYGLHCVSSHVNFKKFMENLDGVIDYNKALGAELCGIGGMPAEYLENGENLKEFIANANRIGSVIRSENMYFGYHNHSKEYGKIDGKLVMDWLIDETDPESFYFTFDTHWAQVGGRSPQGEIKRMKDRIMMVHFKDYGIDCFDSRKPYITEIGNGNLEWDEIFAACEASNVRWGVVEHDNNFIDDDPFKSLKASYDFLTSKGFGKA